MLDAAHLNAFIGAYGYIAVFAIIALESAGVPMPGEATLVTAAIYAGSTHNLNIFGIIACGAGGAIFGDNVGYWVGDRFGLPLLLKYGGYLHLDQPRLKLGQYLFQKHGGKIIFFGRFVAVLRAFAALLAGVNRYPWPHFFAFNAAGGIVWATIFGAGAYVFGRAIDRVAGPVGIAFLVIAVAGGAAFTVFLRRHEKALLDEAERALPGPVTASPRAG